MDVYYVEISSIYEFCYMSKKLNYKILFNNMNSVEIIVFIIRVQVDFICSYTLSGCSSTGHSRPQGYMH